MSSEEQTLLHDPDLVVALLRSAEPAFDGFEAAIAHLRHLREESGEPGEVDWEEVRRRLKRCALQLVAAGALEPVTGNRFRLTARGRQLLAEAERGIDETVLMRFPEYREFVARTGGTGAAEDPRHEAFIAGVEAFHAGLPPTANPHPFDSIDHLAWENGWFTARDEALAARGG